ncbi:DUF2141 domain-containing protein [Catenovulum sp. SM1970]|uniref:DUF2141 domain-containing protein n=1 Tax=Marinifaba aquimaris TaxID=2741323 RepID=UPI001574147C|nr:DUF2141 domain-containing protein [Marinifaba aquimaris]NTS78258.1 DUF2141 domain-containing protein [Marinifaba aquimaris]
MQRIAQTLGYVLTLLFIVITPAIADNTNTFTVNIDNIDYQRGGHIHMLVFEDKHFPIKHDKATLHIKQKAEQGAQTFMANLPTDKPIAIKIWHDEDDNNKVSKNWTSIYPAEGLAFSNKQTLGLTGPPSFSQSAITLSPTQAPLTLELVYP